MMESNKGVSINTTFDEVAANLELQLEGKGINLPVWCGRPGMGKTEHVKMIAEKMGLQLLYISMNKPFEYFSGLPITNHITLEKEKATKKDMNDYETLKAIIDSRYSEKNFSVWTQPDMIHQANTMAKFIRENNYYPVKNSDGSVEKKKCRGVLVFLDDLHAMESSCQKYFFELVLERSLNGYKLDDNVCMMAAMNNSTQSGYEGFFAAITTRLQMIDVFMDFDYWYRNIGQLIHPFISSFLKTMPNCREEDENRMSPFANYRSWTNFGLLLNKMYGESTTIQKFFNGNNADACLKLYRIAKQFVSDKAAAEFKNHVECMIAFDFEDMIDRNAYHVSSEDSIEQLMFGTIVRCLKTEKHGNEFLAFFKTLIGGKRTSAYDSLIMSVATELGSLKQFIKQNIFAGNKTEEFTTQLSIIDKIIDYMYSNKHVVKVLRDLTM